MKAGPRWLWLIPVLVLILPPALEWFRLSSFGFDLAFLMVMPCVLTGLAGLFGMPFALLWLIFRAPKRTGLIAIVYCAALMGAALGGIGSSVKLRVHEFHQLAERSEPLVAAIHRYEKEKGTPPHDLQELVPDYLPAIPPTGMGAYPRYHYLSGTDAVRYGENPWVLMIPTSSGMMNWDEFLYFPRQNYPAQGYGGAFKRMGTWAYLNE